MKSSKKSRLKRFTTDATGYLLLLAAILTGWIPGPGGIPLAIAGLGLLSINNVWARRLRIEVMKRSGNLTKYLFPANSTVQWLYDILSLVLMVLVAVLIWGHAAIWQISLATVLFICAISITAMNRDRMRRLRGRKR